MTLLDGKKVAEKIQSELKEEISALAGKAPRPPGLAALRVGADEASRIYVNRKVKACGEIGMYSRKIELPDMTSEKDLLEQIDKLNRDPEIHGILVQLPLPKHISSERVLAAVNVEKDVDGFHLMNVGRLATGSPGLVACTPLGILRMLDEYDIPIEGKEAVVVGRSNIVGKPMAQLLLSRNATVTICHSKTQDLPGVCRRADILVAAIGRTEMVRGSWVKPDAAVIDVGMNRRADGSLTGDVAFSEASQVARWITPVPGGVGPLTIAMLLSNTVKAAKAQMSVQ